MIETCNSDKTDTADKTCRLFSLYQNYGAAQLTMAKSGASPLFSIILGVLTWIALVMYPMCDG